MILSYMELLYLAAYWILVYEFVVMRHMVVCAESDARINSLLSMRTHRACFGTPIEWNEAMDAQEFYWSRGTK